MLSANRLYDLNSESKEIFIALHSSLIWLLNYVKTLVYLLYLKKLHVGIFLQC
jgi:hypothetical protein